MGRVVWMSPETLEAKQYHAELEHGLQHTPDAISNPAVIARHADYPDRRIYLGHPGEPEDISLAPPQRIVVVSESSDPTGRVITTYDHKKSRPPASVGAIEWRPTSQI